MRSALQLESSSKYKWCACFLRISNWLSIWIFFWINSRQRRAWNALQLMTLSIQIGFYRTIAVLVKCASCTSSFYKRHNISISDKFSDSPETILMTLWIMDAPGLGCFGSANKLSISSIIRVSEQEKAGIWICIGNTKDPLPYSGPQNSTM